MKRYALTVILVFTITLTAVWVSEAATSIMKNTKHDLSSGSSASIKSSVGSGTDQICAFCHTPHSSRKDAPLWNRTDVSGPYTVYNSDVMVGLTYDAADQPTSRTSPVDVHVKTRICLSCHDGTIALGSLVNLPFPLSGNVLMQDGIVTMPMAAAGYIGLNLSDDHPVSILYRGTAKDPELYDSIGGGKVRVYDSTSGNRVSAAGTTVYLECTSCHNAHDNRYGNFLVESNKQSALCTRCHNKTGFASSAHDDNSINVVYQPSDGAGSNLADPGTRVGDVKCMNCHFPHKSGLSPGSAAPNADYGRYLLSFREENSCFVNNPSDRWGTSTAANACHGTSGAKNIETDVNSSYKHQIKDANTTPRHQATEGQSAGWFNTSSVWHTECEDCHNPHTAGPTSHTSPVPVGASIGSSSPIYGVGGVDVTPDFPVGNWAAPNPTTGYTFVKPLGVTDNSTGVDKEYKICFKCHSGYAWYNGTTPTSTSLGAAMTDQAQEFNPNNQSYHPVAGANTVNAEGSTGYTNGWTSASNQTMYCSDCHTRNLGGTPKGTHGSGNPFILVAPYLEDTYGTVGGTHQSLNGLCSQCHLDSVYSTATNHVPIVPPGTDTGFRDANGYNLHNQHRWAAANVPNKRAYRCVNCHVRVAHGWKRKALIVLQGDGVGIPGAPYEAGGPNTGLIVSSTFPAPGTYTQASCGSSQTTNGVTGCHP